MSENTFRWLVCALLYIIGLGTCSHRRIVTSPDIAVELSKIRMAIENKP